MERASSALKVLQELCGLLRVLLGCCRGLCRIGWNRGIGVDVGRRRLSFGGVDCSRLGRVSHQRLKAVIENRCRSQAREGNHGEGADNYRSVEETRHIGSKSFRKIPKLHPRYERVPKKQVAGQSKDNEIGITKPPVDSRRYVAAVSKEAHPHDWVGDAEIQRLPFHSGLHFLDQVAGCFGQLRITRAFLKHFDWEWYVHSFLLFVV